MALLVSASQGPGGRFRMSVADISSMALSNLSCVIVFAFRFEGKQAGLATRPWLSLQHSLDPVPLFQAGLDGFRHLRLDRDLNHIPVALSFNPEKQGVLLRFHSVFPWLRCGSRPEAGPLLVRTT